MIRNKPKGNKMRMVQIEGFGFIKLDRVEAITCPTPTTLLFHMFSGQQLAMRFESSEGANKMFDACADSMRELDSNGCVDLEIDGNVCLNRDNRDR